MPNPLRFLIRSRQQVTPFLLDILLWLLARLLVPVGWLLARLLPALVRRYPQMPAESGERFLVLHRPPPTAGVVDGAFPFLTIGTALDHAATLRAQGHPHARAYALTLLPGERAPSEDPAR